MKSGASDPFSDEEESADESSTTRTADDAASDTASAGESATTGRSGDEGGSTGGLSREELPFVLRRERVKDERPEVHQLFVQRETHERAVDAERELESRLDSDLARTDAREAIYLAGMAQLDDAEAILREWGYDL